MLAAAALTIALCQEPAASDLLPPPLETVDESGIRCRGVEIIDATHVCVVLGVRGGLDHDPPGRTGLARVVEEVLRLHFSADGRTELAVGVRAIGPATMLAATVSRVRVGALIEAYRRLLDGSFALDEDLFARAIARTKLRADDENEIYPGPILASRARRKMLAGDPRGRLHAGIPAELDVLDRETTEAVIAARFVPASAFVIAVGGTPHDDLVEALRGLPRHEPASPEATVHDSGGAFQAATTHPLVDAPFVTAALRAPSWGDEGFVPFLIAMGVLRARAARTFSQYRGGETRARFEFVAFHPLDDPGLVLVNRRGRDGDPLDRPRAEIASLLADLRLDGARPSEIAQSLQELVRTLALPPYGRAFDDLAARHPRALHPRA